MPAAAHLPAALGPILGFLDMAGIAVFALSGALLAAVKKQTLVTFIFFAVVTGVGGGTVRDLLIGAPVFWVHDNLILLICFGAAFAIWLTPARLWRGKTLLWLDAAGLAAYATYGAAKGLAFGLAPLPAFAMGVLTGCMGGIVRDVLAGEPSILMRPELYVTVAALSAALFVGLTLAGAARVSAMIKLDLIERSINKEGMIRALLALLVLLAPASALAQEVAISDRREADGTLTLSHEVVVGAPVADVWAAIATPEGWRTWAVPSSWTVPEDPDSIESSYDPAARPGDPTIIRQHFLARLPGRLLVFRTTRAPQGFPHFETYAQVTSFFELEPVDAAHTRVRLTGTGYANDEAGRLLAGFFRDGNRVSLERLRQRFASGPLDWAAIRAAEAARPRSH